MKVNQPLVLSIVIILACRAINHFIWVEAAKPLIFSYEAEFIPQIIAESDSGVIGNFRKSLNQLSKDYCSSFSYLPWINCQDSHITKAGIKELWNLKDEWEINLSVLEVTALGFLIYNQRRWVALDIFFFQMNGLFYGSFPSFLSTFLSLLQEILKNWVDFPMKSSLAVIRTWEPRVLPLLLLLPLWPYIKSYQTAQDSMEPLLISSIISTLSTMVPLLGIVLHALSILLLDTKKIGMVLTAALLFGFYYIIPKIEAKLQPLVIKVNNFTLPQAGAAAKKSPAPVDKSTSSVKLPFGLSLGTSNGKKK